MDSKSLVGVWFYGEFMEYRWECVCETYKSFVLTAPGVDPYVDNYRVVLYAENKNRIKKRMGVDSSFSDFQLEYLKLDETVFKRIEFLKLFEMFVKQYWQESRK